MNQKLQFFDELNRSQVTLKNMKITVQYAFANNKNMYGQVQVSAAELEELLNTQ